MDTFQLDDDISGFVGGGNGVQKYLDDLKDFETVIMGRKTYQFGYKYGLVPGKLAYPHMKHYIFSKSLSFDNPDEKLVVKDLDISEISKIRDDSNTDVYLCGGGVFSGWLLEHELIDILKLKVSPLLLGQGISLFGDSTKSYSLNLIDTEEYEAGLLINTYEIAY
ncbi:MAG: dihydrofolate reductase [Saprospiraceae bacterium]|jgi:dihydrofolate reductase|tara:strand:- start:31 stop:525 length:495 start_codon:yes stop_codon:yes gene_type:complete